MMEVNIKVLKAYKTKVLGPQEEAMVSFTAASGYILHNSSSRPEFSLLYTTGGVGPKFELTDEIKVALKRHFTD